MLSIFSLIIATLSLAPGIQSTPTASPSAVDAKVGEEYLGPHNAARARHQVGPLAWNETLANFAAGVVKKCVWEHTKGNQFGENLANGGGLTPARGIQLWVDEEKNYNYSNPGFSGGTGHFTQVVWKSSTQLGCAIGFCSDLRGSFKNTNFLVCEYYPPGNYLGRFPQNVFPPKP